MTTVDDVFPLYIREPNKIYNTCTNLANCPNSFDDVCYCYSETPINPITIGNTEVLCNINRKCYIKPNEECPICMESIMMNSTAYLTCCGHSFHKTCIFKSMEAHWNKSCFKNFKCPICRRNLGMDIHNINQRYNFNSNTSYLDEIEHFWLTKEFHIPHLCKNQYDHYLGMKKGCIDCNNYVLTGDI